MRCKLVTRTLRTRPSGQVDLVEEVLVEGDLPDGMTPEQATAQVRDAREVFVIEAAEPAKKARKAG